MAGFICASVSVVVARCDVKSVKVMSGRSSNFSQKTGCSACQASPADDITFPPTPDVMESDTDHRLRIQQAIEGLIS
ncbi:hypothetical protein C2E44_04925 [Enterobacter ludwigii]|nr:hypothetical protein C2E44_04925 [Enterobacter ludwigii]